MKKIAMLLNNPIDNDYRVIKMIRTLSSVCKVDLFYVKKVSGPKEPAFNSNVRLFGVHHSVSMGVKLKRHSYFCNEFNYYFDKVLEQNTKYDFIWANDLPTLKPAYKLSKKLNCKLVYDSHEIYNETLNQFFPRESSFLKGMVFRTLLGIMKRHGKSTERELIRKVDYFITVNGSLLNYFKEEYGISNGISIMNFPNRKASDDSPVVDYRSMFNWEEKSKIFIYQGLLNEGRGLKLLVSTFTNTAPDNKLVIIGDGPIRQQLSQIAEDSNNQDRIKFVGKVPLKDLPGYTKGADIGVNLLEDLNLSKKLASPNKLFEYIQAGIPILCTDTVENRKVIDKYKLGILVDNKPETLLEGIGNIVLFVSQQTQLEENMAKARSEYNWEEQEGDLIKYLGLA